MSEDHPTRLTVIGTTKIKGKTYSVCRCVCGNEKTIRQDNLRSGHAKSCGCLMSVGRKTHGKHKTPIYMVWQSMISRCECKKSHSYKTHGGRGITVCARWRESFENFLADVGDRPEGMQLDRFPDNNGNYEPGNVRWATPSQNNRNRRDNRKIACNGVEKLLCEWAEETGLDVVTILSRLKRGWSPEESLMTPAGVQSSFKRAGN